MQYPTRTGPTTNDQAAFSPSMAQGYQPSESPIRKPFTSGGYFAPPDVLVFSVEMAQGVAPSRPRLFTGPQVGVQLSQTTHTAAAFSVEMATGVHPSRERQYKAFTTGAQVLPPDVLSFSVEMAQGSAPSKPRLFLAPRIALPISQTTHTDAPFTSSMTAGAMPAAIWRTWLPHGGGQVLPPTVDAVTSRPRPIVLASSQSTTWALASGQTATSTWMASQSNTVSLSTQRTTTSTLQTSRSNTVSVESSE